MSFPLCTDYLFTFFVTCLLVDYQDGVLIHYRLALSFVLIEGLRWYPLPHNGSRTHVLSSISIAKVDLQSYSGTVFSLQYRARER